MKDSAIFLDSDRKEGLFTECYHSPIGALCIGATYIGLRFVKTIGSTAPQHQPNAITSATVAQLKLYFNHELRIFDIPFDLHGHTEFSTRVWRALLEIPYGHTTTYMTLSRNLGDIKAIRAVGTAKGRNPIPIIIPCHRVIGSDGSLTGFALGLAVKKQLLAIENPEIFGVSQGTLEF